MPVYYPQGIMTLRVRLEDHGDTENVNLQELHAFSVVCRRVRVQLNSYLEADTFDAEIDFKNFPFDPRSIRSAGVTIHVEDRKRIFRTNNSLRLLQPTEESIIFQGFADEDNIELDEEKRTVRLEGRDFTSLLLDQEYVGDPIATTKPIDQVIKGLLEELEATAEIEILNQTNGTLPTISQFSPTFNKEAAVKNGRPRKTYWDMIQSIVEQAGLIGYISLDKFVLSKPRALYNKSKAKKFVYGHNLKSLTFTRKLGRQKGFNIRVLSLDIEKKKVLEAKIPEEATEAWTQDISLPRKRIQVPNIKPDGTQGEPKDAPFITFRVPNVTNKDQLVSIGEKIFEEVGRQQIEGSLSTKEMVICDKENDFFNATEFRIGTPIEVSIDQGDLEGMPRLLESGSQSNRVNRIKKFLIERCYDPKIALAFAQSLVKFNAVFFTKAVEFTLDQENGWTMDIDFINFIELPQNLAGTQ